MGDFLGFVAFITSLFAGLDEVIGQSARTVLKWSDVQLEKANRKVFPKIARAQQRILMWSVVAMILLIAGVYFWTRANSTGLTTVHAGLVGFMSIGLLWMRIRIMKLEHAIPKEIPGQTYPATHPFAGQTKIDRKALKPDQIKPIRTTIGLIFFVGGTSFGLCILGAVTHDSVPVFAGLVIAFSLFEVLRLLGHGAIVVFAKGSGAAAYALRIGLMQALVPFMGITTENVEEKVKNITGIEEDKLTKPFDRGITVLEIFFTTSYVLVLAHPYVGMLFIAIVFMFVSGAMSSINMRSNPLQEEQRFDRTVNRLRMLLPFAAVFPMLWRGFAEKDPTKHGQISELLSRCWDTLFGTECWYPSGENWWLALFSGFFAVGIFRVVMKKDKIPAYGWAAAIASEVVLISLFVYGFMGGMRAWNDQQICPVFGSGTPETRNSAPNGVTPASGFQMVYATSTPPQAAPLPPAQVVQTDSFIPPRGSTTPASPSQPAQMTARRRSQ